MNANCFRNYRLNLSKIFIVLAESSEVKTQPVKENNGFINYPVVVLLGIQYQPNHLVEVETIQVPGCSLHPPSPKSSTAL